MAKADGHSPYEAALQNFGSAQDLASATKLVWNCGYYNFYQHYTTLSSVLTKISERRWWLSRSSSTYLNDRQESLKYGDRTLADKTYQASFVHDTGESAALWGLYCASNPFAIRITIPGNAMKDWVDSIRDVGIYHELKGKVEKSASEEFQVDFRDVIYASVPFKDALKTRLDINRSNLLSWHDIVSSSRIEGLESEVQKSQYTGWLKDSEWSHEQESRLCVRIGKRINKDGLYVKVTDKLVKEMKFTFSPWLPEVYEPEVESILRAALRVQSDKDVIGDSDKERRRFRRSVLQGALNLSRQKSICPVLEEKLLAECLLVSKI